MYDFGLSDEQFWKLTPAKFSALSGRHEHANRQSDLRAGFIGSVIANVNRDEAKKPDPYTAEDFFPDPYEADDENAPAKAARKAGEMTPEQILRHMKAAFPKKPKKALPSEAHG